MDFLHLRWPFRKTKAGHRPNTENDPAAPLMLMPEQATPHDDPQNVPRIDFNAEAQTDGNEQKETVPPAAPQAEVVLSGQISEPKVEQLRVLPSNDHVAPEGNNQNRESEKSSSILQDLHVDFDYAAHDLSEPSSNSLSPSQRRATWHRFIKQHEIILRKRIAADELRRRVRQQRQAFIDLFRSLALDVNQSGLGPSSQASELGQRWLSTGSEVEELERLVEQTENDLVQAEFLLGTMLPRILGSEASRTFDNLQADDFFFELDSGSLVSERREPDPDEGEEISPQRALVLQKLAEVNDLEEQMIELRDDKQRLRSLDGEDLSTAQSSFLDTYTAKKDELRDQLRTARTDLENLRSSLQPDQKVEDDVEQQDSPVFADLKQAPVVDTGEVEKWLDNTQQVLPETRAIPETLFPS